MNASLTLSPLSFPKYAVSAEVDAAKLSAFFAAIDGKDVAELIKEGTAKLASVPSGGGGGGGGGGGAAAAEPEPEEEEEEEAGDFDLFD